jgi:hypothetical protein
LNAWVVAVAVVAMRGLPLTQLLVVAVDLEAILEKYQVLPQ